MSQLRSTTLFYDSDILGSLLVHSRRRACREVGLCIIGFSEQKDRRAWGHACMRMRAWSFNSHLADCLYWYGRLLGGYGITTVGYSPGITRNVLAPFLLGRQSFE
jgi:hypothetical protein